MLTRFCGLALALTIGVGAATEASAFFARDEERPPPNGLNGLTVNGLTVNGLTLNGLTLNGQSVKGQASEITTLKAVILHDGSRVVLK